MLPLSNIMEIVVQGQFMRLFSSPFVDDLWFIGISIGTKVCCNSVRGLLKTYENTRHLTSMLSRASAFSGILVCLNEA
jgi:hypothetical protein